MQVEAIAETVGYTDSKCPVILNQTATLRAAAFLPDGSAASRVVEATFAGARLADGNFLSTLPAVDGPSS